VKNLSHFKQLGTVFQGGKPNNGSITQGLKKYKSNKERVIHPRMFPDNSTIRRKKLWKIMNMLRFRINLKSIRLLMMKMGSQMMRRLRKSGNTRSAGTRVIFVRITGFWTVRKPKNAGSAITGG
jgi:hypothetical protein